MELSRRDFFKEESQTNAGMAMLVDVSKCVSCWWCYAACKDHNKLPETIKPELAQPPALSPSVWTTLHPVKKDEEWISRKHACNHCTDAACVEVCPTGALSYNKLGFVQYDKAKCSGCGYCAEFCPFAVPQMESNRITGVAVMNKCDFCKDRVTNGEQPACAAACTAGAIIYGQRTELVQQGRERVIALRQANPDAALYGDKELGGLHVMYVLDDAPEIYGLPADPEVPAPVMVRDALKWVGVGAAIAMVVGFVLNFVVAREVKMAGELPGKEYMRKSK